MRQRLALCHHSNDIMNEISKLPAGHPIYADKLTEDCKRADTAEQFQNPSQHVKDLVSL